MTRAAQPELCHALVEIGVAFGFTVYSHLNPPTRIAGPTDGTYA